MINSQLPNVTDQNPLQGGRPKTREKRYRIELGVGDIAKDALDRWRLFVEAWEFPSQTELLHKALDSLLARSRCEFSSRHIGIQCAVESGEVGCQYRLLDTIVSSPTSKYSRTEFRPAKIAAHPGNGRQRVKRRRCPKKKTPGVGVISETTKRILLEHIPKASTGANGDKSDSNSGAKGEADFVAVPPPPPSIHTGTQKGEGLTNTSKPSVSLYSQLMPCATEARTSHLTRHKPPSLTLNRPSEARLGSRLVALSRPLLCDTSATRKLIPNPMVVASAPLSTMCDLPKAVPGDGLMTTLAASVPTFASVTSAVKQEATGIINGVTVPSFTPAEELPPKKKIRGSGNFHRERKYVPRKKTKGLGGSISDATRRILLEHTDRLADAKSVHSNTPVDVDPKATLVTVANSPISKLREESPSRQNMTFSGPISESTKRILLEYYT